MSEPNKIETPFLDKFLGKQKINGKPISKYTVIYILKSVLCQSCSNMIAPNSIVWKKTIQELQDVAEHTHAQGIAANRVICANPQLFIVWDNGFIDSRLLK